MNYELAKKLKDRQFPYQTNGYFIEPSGMIVTGSQIVDRLDIGYVPTLQELIEACTVRMPHFRLMLKGSIWMANFDDDFGRAGATPSQAVANLWLALNDATMK